MKYIPLVAYEFSGTCYIIFAKRKRNGIVTFRSRKLTRAGTCSYKYPDLDINENFKKLIKE
jgi:hypothetical protein